ncbi:MAG TPA: hypothetical protein VEI97_10005, partial [bacterium]|nr:hypothetical protein [bacterium]
MPKFLWYTLVLLLLPAGLLAQVPATAQAHAYAADAHRDTLPLDQRFYTRYVSWAGIPVEKTLPWQRVFWGKIRFLSQEQEFVRPGAVPGTLGLLWHLDVRDYKWNEAAWASVQARDYAFEIPLVTGETAYRLRFYSGVYKDELKLGAICLASDLFRRSAESLIDPTYYDLLFADQRHKDIKWLEYRDATGRIEQYGLQFKFTDFPATERDLDGLFGVTLAAEQARKAGFLNRWGSIVPGVGDNPKEGSYVSNNERFLQIETQAPGGVKLKTFDLKDNSAVDLLEDAPKFVEDELPKADGGRIFWTLPNGLYAKLLVDGAGKRVEIAPTNIVSGRIGGRNCDVRTAIGCIQCHVPERGFLVGTNAVATTLSHRVDRVFVDPHDSRAVRDKGRRYMAFYLRWEQKIEGWRTEFWYALNEAINPPGLPPMTPAE